MNANNGRGSTVTLAALAAMVIVDVALIVARVVEVDAGHTPTGALTLAFQAAMTATVAALVAVVHYGGRP